MTTYTATVIPAGLERALRELGARTHYHPDEVVHHARTAGMYKSEATSGQQSERDELLADLARSKVLAIAEQACACSVEVRPTNEYHDCLCWAGTVVKRFARYLDNVERRARANITVG